MRIFITSVFLLLTNSLWCQVNDNDAFFDGTYNKNYIREHKVKQVTVVTYIDRKKPFLCLFDFDKRGFLKRKTIFNSSGKRLNEYEFTYNRQGDQIQRDHFDYALNTTQTVTYEKTYQDARLILESEGSFYFTRHIYNKQGHKIQSVSYFGPDSILSQKKSIAHYTYDSLGKLVSQKQFLIMERSGINANTGNTEYVYDPDGNLITVIRDGKVVTEYVYDPDGNPITVIRYGKANYKLSYDESGLLKRTDKLPEKIGGMGFVNKYSYIFWK